MFEKEAEEYVNEEYDFCYYPEDNLSARINAEYDWQQGAEFGYNKANERFTKAKEIIKGLINSLIAIDGEEIRELSVVKEAEWLLNSENI